MRIYKNNVVVECKENSNNISEILKTLGEYLAQPEERKNQKMDLWWSEKIRLEILPLLS